MAAYSLLYGAHSARRSAHHRGKRNDGNYGDLGYGDNGQIEEDGETVWFDSDISGSSLEGTVENPLPLLLFPDWELRALELHVLLLPNAVRPVEL
jgi:hypothetical protein